MKTINKDILRQLETEHEEVAKLFGKLKKMKHQSIAARKSIFLEIHEKLGVHAQAEEEVLYTRLLAPQKTKDMTFEAYQEHRLVKQLLAELAEFSGAKEVWTAKLTVLNELVDHHVKEEENDLFKKVRTLLSQAERASLCEEYLLRKEAILSGEAVEAA